MDEAGHAALAAALLEVFPADGASDDGTMVADVAYLEVVATRA